MFWDPVCSCQGPFVCLFVVPHPLVPVGAAALQYHYREAFNGVGSEAEDKCSAVNE